MPPDTIYIPQQTGPPPPDTFVYGMDSMAVAEYLRRTADSTGQIYLQEKTSEQPQYLLPEWQLFLIILVILLVSMFFYIVKPSLAVNRKKKNRVTEPVAGRDFQYDFWLKQYNPYYNSLSKELQEIFLRRTILFIQSKEFRFHAMTEEENIPVLISGAAVQITFGLTNYIMDYFSVIHVIPAPYVLQLNDEMYDGHVSRTGIYISWNRFQEGFKYYNDSRNLGLHEMAHAISYDAFLGHEDKDDRKFKQRLREFNEKGVPVFRAMRKGVSNILDEYATTNFDEFWAVCVESFFENPAEFKRTLTGLYVSICSLLNQNPLTAGKIIDKKLAGLAI